MKLSLETLKNGELSSLGYILPQFDIEKMREKTMANPTWIHFGAGNILRAFTCVLSQKLLDENKTDTGMIVVETYDEEIIDKAFTPYDDLCVAVSLKGNGTVEKRIVASVAKALGYRNAQSQVESFFVKESLQMVSFTITEKGYAVLDAQGQPLSYCKNDFESAENPVSIVGIITRLMLKRYLANAKPLALVSMDNCAHNGTILQNAVFAIAKAWLNAGIVDAGFINYLENQVSFTWSMIDKITPRPAQQVLDMVASDGLEGMETTVTSKNTYVSALVNAEECEYLAIEDNFPNGRPPLEEVGVIFGTRETVDRIEKMKVCTCLNPLHTALAIFGCLLGHTTISAEMSDEVLVEMVKKLGYVEGMPVVVDPGVMNAKTFIDEVITLRLPNPFLPDTPQRIACDTSKKLSVRFGETIKAYQAKGVNDLSDMSILPLVYAGYARYLTGVDDAGNSFEPSPDPSLATLKKHVEGFELGKEFDTKKLQPLFSDENLCGVNLYSCGLGEKAEKLFTSMNAGVGAVYQTIKSCI